MSSSCPCVVGSILPDFLWCFADRSANFVAGEDGGGKVVVRVEGSKDWSKSFRVVTVDVAGIEGGGEGRIDGVVS